MSPRVPTQNKFFLYSLKKTYFLLQILDEKLSLLKEGKETILLVPHCAMMAKNRPDSWILGGEKEANLLLGVLQSSVTADHEETRAIYQKLCHTLYFTASCKKHEVEWRYSINRSDVKTPNFPDRIRYLDKCECE